MGYGSYVEEDTPVEMTADIYLCQVREKLSCGACCGLYNLPDLSREKLEALLSERTREFASVARTEDAIYEFQRKCSRPHRLSRPFPQFHHCPFLGLVGRHRDRVGCLLHPAAPGNKNVDYRSLSWYGELACRNYFCPATEALSTAYKSILIEVVDDWYVFGLLVTEHTLLNGYFREVEARLAREITVRDFRENSRARDAAWAFFHLKLDWPYRRQGAPGLCNYFFANGLYSRPGVVRANRDIRQSRYEQILGELDSGFSSTRELAVAERLLDRLFAQLAHALA